MSADKTKKNKIPFLYIIFLIVVLSCWSFYVISTNSFFVFAKHWAAILTMIFGSFIAGSSPEGSAAVAYPVFTLLLKIEPAVARNFAFAIQSIGMTSASLLILGLKIKVDWNYIKYVTIGGAFGLIFGTYYIVPLISPPLAKLFFVSLWLSFGLVLWYENRHPHREVFDKIQNFIKSDIARLLFFGLIGGMISSIFGTGINIFTFCLMTIYYRIDEKVAVPSSVIIMTFETILGFFVHGAIIADFQQEAFEMWIACVPFVAFFAPLGSFVISKLPRQTIATFLYIILIIQFFGAIWVLKPSLPHLGLCLITLLAGLGTFAFLARLKRKM
ncbi:sulfite exporter TauE/SafE family protein [Emticicia sp.]|uniref:sulfite exporter TauE/SafE family protein n=1 Tax=Emticicia sp. TaxID=1930953 RepID=UPI00375009EB